MIVFFAPGGRLGNLLFQHAFISSIRKPGEYLLCTQLKNLPEVVEIPTPFLTTDWKLLVRAVDWFIRPFIRYCLVPLHIVSSFIEKKGKVHKTNGILPIRYVEGYFQADFDSANKKNKIVLSQKDKARAKSILAKVDGYSPVFLHVRRGDYLDWKVLGVTDPSLPPRYYQEAIAEIKEAAGAEKILHFFVIGDDGDWNTETFSKHSAVTFVQGTPGEDLALMSLCDGGVVSNSTFAWWGGALCQKTLPVIGPKFWLGWKSKTWYPEAIETPWMTYIDVRNGLEGT